MGIFNTAGKMVLEKVNKMNLDHLRMIANFEVLEKEFDKFENRTKNDISDIKAQTEKSIEKITTECRELDKRLTTVEGRFNSSLIEGIRLGATEYMKNNGEINPDDINKLDKDKS